MATKMGTRLENKTLSRRDIKMRKYFAEQGVGDSLDVQQSKLLDSPRNVRINKVTIIQELDESPDLSYLGHYSNSPETKRKDEYAIKRENPGRGEYEYFIAENVEGTPAQQKKYALENYKRMQDIDSGDTPVIGVHAEAEIVVDNTIQRISSGGLWGIESDSGKQYIEEIENDELDNLNRQLSALGISADHIDVGRKEWHHNEVTFSGKKFSTEKSFVDKKNAEKESSGMRLGMGTGIGKPVRSSTRRSGRSRRSM